MTNLFLSLNILTNLNMGELKVYNSSPNHIYQIQLDAHKQGILDAAEIVYHHSEFTLHNNLITAANNLTLNNNNNEEGEGK